MKALSIKQPWASLICTPREDNPALGMKDIENRTWKTNFRGRIYVHASGKPASEPYQIFTDDQWKSIEEKQQDFFVFNSYSELSQIIGEVDIIDCVINHESIWAEKTFYKESEKPKEFYIPDGKPIYNWVLANPVLYEKPIPCKGKLSFWEPDFDIEECIWCSGKFDFEIMSTDGTENYCPECWKEAEPILQAEYDELKANGEID